MGSIADIHLQQGDDCQPDADLRSDQRAFITLLVQIEALMEEHGVVNNRAREWASVFRKWLADGAN